MTRQWFDDESVPPIHPRSLQNRDRVAELDEFIRMWAPPPGKGAVWPKLLAAARELIPLIEMADRHNDEYSSEAYWPGPFTRGEYHLSRELLDHAIYIHMMLVEVIKIDAEMEVEAEGSSLAAAGWYHPRQSVLSTQKVTK